MQNKKSSDLIGQRNERITKVKKLKKLGIDPYPTKADRTHYSSDIVNDFKSLNEREVTVSGRLMSWREHGKLIFSDLQDSTGRIQLYIREDTVSDTNTDKQILGFSELSLMDIGDIAQATGVVTKTQRGEVSILVKEFKILTKAIRPLPDQWDGLKDKELKNRKRYLDTTIDPSKKYRFQKMAEILFALRTFMNDKGFLEMKTPIIQPIYGGTNAKPFKTHVNALDVDYYLAVAHELYLKRLITAGFENVYNIVGYFRNEGIDRSHNPEFMMLETMSAYQNYEYNMDLIEEMYRYIGDKVFDRTTFKVRDQEVDFGKPWERIMMIDAVKKYGDIDFHKVTKLKQAHKILEKLGLEDRPASIGESMVKVFEEKVEDILIQPTFITGHPVEISPLAKSMPDNSKFVERFEIFIGGIEGGDNWTELNDPIELYDRLKEQVERGRGGDDEFHPMDVEFLEAMEYGMPPTTGLGPGIERLAMMYLETEYIDDVIFFPMMRPAPVTKLQKEIYGEEYLTSETTDEALKEFDINSVKTLDLAEIDIQVAEKYPGIKFGYIVLDGVSVEKANAQLSKLKSQVSKQVKDRYDDKSDIRSSNNLAGFREIYKDFGVDPNSRMNSAEALISRIVSGKGVYNINNVVDTYNITSAEFELPMAAYDLEQVSGKLKLRLAEEGDEIVKIGEDKATKIDQGELVYADDKGVTCMDFNYRDADRTKITNNSQKIIVFVDGHNKIQVNEIEKALTMLATRLEKFTGGSVVGKGIVNTETLENNQQNNNKKKASLPTITEAQKLLEKHVDDEYQKLHAKMVAQAMKAYAQKFGEDEDLWYITGLLHDLDYGKYPDEHPEKSIEWFRKWDYPQELIHAISAHKIDESNPPKTKLAAALIACDEIAGLIYAYYLMRPNKFEDMKPKSVKKKFKDKSFAAKINRDDIKFGIKKLKVEFADHVKFLIEIYKKMPELN